MIPFPLLSSPGARRRFSDEASRSRQAARCEEGAMETLVSTEWLERELGASDLRILDATLLLPGDARDPRAEYQAGHIPGAAFLDLEDVSDSSNPVPHMLPGEAKMASRMQALGVRDGQRIVVYDDSPLHSSA